MNPFWRAYFSDGWFNHQLGEVLGLKIDQDSMSPDGFVFLCWISMVRDISRAFIVRCFFFSPFFLKKNWNPKKHPPTLRMKKPSKACELFLIFDGRVSRSGILWKILDIKDLKVSGLWSGLRLPIKKKCEGIFWDVPKIMVPQNGWFIRENPIKMDDLVVPLFLETTRWRKTATQNQNLPRSWLVRVCFFILFLFLEKAKTHWELMSS